MIDQICKIWRKDGEYLLKRHQKPDVDSLTTTQIATHYMRVTSIPEELKKKTVDSFKASTKIYQFLKNHNFLAQFFKLAETPDVEVKFSSECLRILANFTPQDNSSILNQFILFALSRLASNTSRKPIPKYEFK